MNNSHRIFQELGFEFYKTEFTSQALDKADQELQEYFLFARIHLKARLKRRVLAYRLLKMKHLKSLVKKPGPITRLYLTFIEKLVGYRI